MSVIAPKKELMAYLSKNKDRLYALPYTNYDPQGNAKRRTPKQAYRDIRGMIQTGRLFSKGMLRPWNVTPPKDRLDPAKVWVGFEVETGYNATAIRDRVIKWFDKAFNRAVYDTEGAGRAPVEFTFYPVHLEDMERKSGPYLLIKKGKEADYAPVAHAWDHRIGTHLNVSTPARREGRNIDVAVFRTALTSLDFDEQQILFGRGRPAMNWYIYTNYVTHYEFKVFNTTYDLKQWDKYMITAHKLIEIILLMEQNPQMTHGAILTKLREAVAQIRAYDTVPKLKKAA